MATCVRSYSKINLGLAIGPVRADGFHGLTTLYQTLGLHDLVTVSARVLEGGSASRISLSTNHRFVPTDGRNTAWKMVERCLARLGVAAEVAIHIEKNLPVQGGLGAGSANAAAALLGLERELGVSLPGVERLQMAAEVGSDVPLFLLGGAVLGRGRGEQVVPMPDLPRMWCVVAVPEVGVSTPQAFRDWDALVAGGGSVSGAKAPLSGEASGTAEAVPLTRRMDGAEFAEWAGAAGLAERTGAELAERIGAGFAERIGDGFAERIGDGLTSESKPDRLNELSIAYASLSAKTGDDKPGTSGIVRDANPEKKQGLSGENQSYAMNDLAENTLLALVRTGMGNDGLHGLKNDFEEVVFPQYPSLRITKRQLMGNDSGASEGPAIYAALSGSGSALFGLYGSERDARAAQHRVQASGVKSFVTETLPREEYWARMFAG
jgi:4-diphosphocytidyl-2-C-methyl-D-erythritol kinase